ncbi:YpiF family protein [Oceanobacillus rekensis]|uniref:YpiF family protein n=1 Tax=Oceanobacillus rekensis TaxID=937927 RepID=UPI000B4420BD|nr:YpiF family protein [Oceanobacillus rekensis]
MKWKRSDLQQYVQAKEYIDTILLPLVPIQLSNDEETDKYSAQAEVMSILANGIEKELTGRTMLLPNYNYLKTVDITTEVQRLNNWTVDMQQQPFAHITYITFDSRWKKEEKGLIGNLLWMPAVQTGEIHSKEMQRIIRDQVGQTVELIRSYWN